MSIFFQGAPNDRFLECFHFQRQLALGRLLFDDWSRLTHTKKLCKCLPNSWRYMQSCFGHGMFFMKCEQYLVVPKDAFRVRPSASTLLTACIARNASSDL